jgi:hypothetical protein
MKQLFRPLKLPKLIEDITSRGTATSTLKPDSTRHKRMSYRHISICLSDLPTSRLQSKDRRNEKTQTASLRGDLPMRQRHHTRSVRTTLAFLPTDDPRSKQRSLHYPLFAVAHARHQLTQLSNTISQLLNKYPCFRILDFRIYPVLPSDFLAFETYRVRAKYQKEVQTLSGFLTRLEDGTWLKTRFECYDARRIKPLGDRVPSQVMIRYKFPEFWRLEQVLADMEILMRRSVGIEAADNEGDLSGLEKDLSALETYHGNVKHALEVIQGSFSFHSDSGILWVA